jgi:ligand-binding sensor domain-containing protein
VSAVLRCPRKSSAARVAVLLALCASSSQARAVPEREPISRYVHARWGQCDGLPHNVVQRVLAARTGYLWIGTQEGLVRFDGARMRLFERFTTPGLAGDEITGLAEDAAGDLWIGTYSGLSRLRGEAFEAVDLGDGPTVPVLAVQWDGSALWVATAAGLHRLHRGAWEAHPIAPGAGPDPPTALARAGGGGVWIGTTRRLLRWVDDHILPVDARGLPGEGVTALVEDAEGTLWVGTPRGLARRRRGQAAFEPVARVGDRAVSALLQDRAGALWIASTTGLQRLDGEALELLPGRPVHFNSIVEDAEGSLWLGTETDGLHRLRRGEVQTIASEEGLSSEVVWALAEGAGGVVWVSGDGGLDRLVGDRPAASHRSELKGTNLTALLEDRGGQLWLGTEAHGLMRFGQGRPSRYGPDQGLRGMVRVILQDRAGTVWVGTRDGVFRLEGGRFLPAGSSTSVNAMAQGPDGALWVGSTAGLLRGAGDALAPAPLPGWTGPRDVTALRFDTDGTLWLGTNGDGLWRLRGGQAHNFTRRHGLGEDIVFAIVDDEQGSLWLSGNHGIGRVRRAELEEVAAGRRERVSATVLGRADGMKEAECNGGLQPAGFRAADGRLWFATLRGAVVVDPSRFAANPRPPRLVVEDVVADGRRFPPAPGLHLPPGTRHLEIRYTGIGFGGAERIRFRHRLDGLDEEDVEAGVERVAHYAGLGPGRYTFHLTAAQQGGAWNEAGEMLGFEIDPQAWQSPGFRLAALLAVLALLLGAFQLRLRGLRAQRRALAAQVEEEMKKVKVLSGLLPICAWCKKIRDDGGEWQTIEKYVAGRSDAAFTHSMCPDCFQRMESADR